MPKLEGKTLGMDKDRAKKLKREFEQDLNSEGGRYNA